MWCDGQLHVDVRGGGECATARIRDWDFACQIRWGLGCGGTGRLLFVPHHTSSLCVEHICCCAPHKLYSNKSGIATAKKHDDGPHNLATAHRSGHSLLTEGGEATRGLSASSRAGRHVCRLRREIPRTHMHSRLNFAHGRFGVSPHATCTVEGREANRALAQWRAASLCRRRSARCSAVRRKP